MFFKDVKEKNKTIKGEWLGVKEGNEIVYVLDTFLSKDSIESKTKTGNNLNIYILGVLENDKNFIGLSDCYGPSNHPDSIVISEKYIGDKYIKEDSIQNTINRIQFLSDLQIKETDSIYIYNYKSDTCISIAVSRGTNMCKSYWI